MEEKSTVEKQKKLDISSKGNLTIWIVAAVIVIIIIGIVYLSRGGYRSASPVSAPSSTSSTTQNTGTNQNGGQTSGTAVTIQNFAFSPATLEVSKGDIVTWTNEDSVPHQIASDTNVFLGSSMNKGQTFSFTFTETGIFPYHCAIHPSMQGKIIVK
jgi:plastocyanin